VAAAELKERVTGSVEEAVGRVTLKGAAPKV